MPKVESSTRYRLRKLSWIWSCVEQNANRQGWTTTSIPICHNHNRENVGLPDCQKELSTGFTTASTLVSEVLGQRDEHGLLRFQKQAAGHQLLIIDELGFVPLSKPVAKLLFELTPSVTNAAPHQ